VILRFAWLTYFRDEYAQMGDGWTGELALQ
jgi:hypothetical protein